MADLEAQRTLVKSPPELWAELSDPESLARRLSDFGEIRITRLVPETTVAWEGERASGTVELESSGWGTKVRLTARSSTPAAPPVAARDRIVAVIENDDAEPEPSPDPVPAPPATSTSGSARAEDVHPAGGRRISSAAQRSAARMARRAAEAEAAAAAAAVVVVEAPAPPAPTPAEPTPVARPGFFARFFRRGKRPATPALAPPPPAPEPGVELPDPAPDPPAPAAASTPPPSDRPGRDEEQTLPHATIAPARLTEESARYAASMSGSSAPTRRSTTASAGLPPAAPAAPSAERTQPSGLDPEQTLALLSGVLDDLGSAHHRPFSRE
jgi:hypothetical protein